MIIVLVLSDKRNCSLGVVLVESWHIQVIDKVNHLILANWSITSTGLPFKLLFELVLEERGIGVEVEVNNLLEILFLCWIAELVEKTLSDLSLSATSLANQHWRVVHFNEFLHQELSTDCINCWNSKARDWLLKINFVRDILCGQVAPLGKCRLLEVYVVVED